MQDDVVAEVGYEVERDVRKTGMETEASHFASGNDLYASLGDIVDGNVLRDEYIDVRSDMGGAVGA